MEYQSTQLGKKLDYVVHTLFDNLAFLRNRNPLRHRRRIYRSVPFIFRRNVDLIMPSQKMFIFLDFLDRVLNRTMQHWYNWSIRRSLGKFPAQLTMLPTGGDLQGKLGQINVSRVIFNDPRGVHLLNYGKQ
jgi:hypothetical protein